MCPANTFLPAAAHLPRFVLLLRRKKKNHYKKENKYWTKKKKLIFLWDAVPIFALAGSVSEGRTGAADRVNTAARAGTAAAAAAAALEYLFRLDSTRIQPGTSV